MRKKAFHFAWHISKFSVKMSLLFAFIAFVCVAGFVGRVHQSPLDISFAKDYIQSAMRDAETGSYARMESVVLYWPDLTDALYLQMKGGQLLNKNDVVVLSVDEVAISFSRYGLLIGKVMPKAIILKQPTLQLTRTDQGFDLDLGTRPYGPEQESDEKVEFTTRMFGYLARPGYESAHQSIISRLRAFEIRNAKLRVDDHVVRQSWSLPEFNVGFYSTEKGMSGQVSAKLPDIGLSESSLSADFEYIWDEKTVSLSADLNNFAVQQITGKIPELSSFGEHNIVLDAHAETLLDENFMPSDIRVSLSSKEGSLVLPDVWEEATPYEGFSVNATYSYSAKALRLYDTALTIGGIRVNAQADIAHEDFDKPDMSVTGPVKVWIDEAKQFLIDPLWPKALRGDNSEEWVVKKMSKGMFKDIELTLDVLARKIPASADNEDGNGEGGWSFDAQNVSAKFAAEGMDIDYRSPLDPAVGVSGTGTFDLNRDELTIDISKGSIGTMPVSKARMVFDKVVAVGEGGADLNIDLNAPIVDVFRFISKDPINLGDRIDMDLKQVKGTADLSIWLNFPTQDDVKLSDFKVGVDGTLTSPVLPDVIETLDLGGKSLDFAIKDGAVSLKGNATLDKRPMEFEWHSFLNSEGKAFKEKIKAKIKADPNIRSQLGIDLSEFLEGSADVDIVYTAFRNKTAKAHVVADVTPALFFVEPFGYEKKPGEKGRTEFDAHLKNGVLEKITGLTGKADGFDLSKTEVQFQQVDGKTELLSGTTSGFVVGNTKGALDFSFDKGGTATINMKASVLDAQPFMEPKDKVEDYNEPPMKITVTATNMLTAPEEVMRDVRLYYDIDGQGRFNIIKVDGAVGSGTVRARFNPDAEGRKVFNLSSDDAGAMLKAFQLYNNIRGGQMNIKGSAPKGAGDYNISGTAEITDFKVVNAPALTKILSILSLTGIGEALTSDGLEFDKLESKFEWIYRPKGSLLKMEDGRTSGNAIGLLFSGELDNEKRYIDVSGTVVPMSLVNEIIGSIPLIGDILTGGTGGIFAATYSVKGPSNAPEVFVNPLSVLTPGIARRVIFE